MFIEGMKSGQENSWMNNLSEENMKLVAQLTFDSIGSDPRYNVFSPDAPGFEPSQTQIESLIESYLNENDEIATALIGSLGLDEHIKDHIYTNSLKAANQAWLDWDFGNLSL